MGFCLFMIHLDEFYRVSQVVVDLGWVYRILSFPLSAKLCHAADGNLAEVAGLLGEMVEL